MANFSGVDFPQTSVGMGSSVGLGHKTQIVGLVRGEETRNVGWGHGARRFQITKIGASKSELDFMRTFISFHGGARDGFYFTDPLDFSSNADHVSTPTMTDEWVGISDGTAAQTFPLIKRYDKNTRWEIGRRALGVVDVIVAVNDGINGPVKKIQGVDYSVDTTNGVITFMVTIPRGHEITAGFLFRVRVRFDDSSDDWLGEVYAGFEVGEINVSLAEEKSPLAVPERMDFGGSVAVLSPSAQEILELQDGFFHLFVPTAPMVLHLPDIRGQQQLQSTPSYARTMQRGGPMAIVFNASTTAGATITFKEKIDIVASPFTALRTTLNGGVSGTVSVLNPGQVASLYINSASVTWDPDSISGQTWSAQ